MSPAGWRRVAVPAAALVAVLLLAWASAAGPLDVVGDWRDLPAQGTDQGPDDSRVELGEPPSTDLPDDQVDQARGQAWLRDVVDMLALLLGLLVLAWLVRAAARQLRLPEKRQVIDEPPLTEADDAREALSRDRDRQQRALEEGVAAEGIVACWVALERSAEDAGVPRLVSETPTEFVVRLLHGLDVDPRPVAALARLYHEARFSSHRMGPDARDRARAALDALHDDLRVAVR